MEQIAPILLALQGFDATRLSIIISAVLLVVFMLHSGRQAKRYLALHHLEAKKFSQLLQFTDGKLIEILNIATERARTSITKTYQASSAICPECKSPIDAQPLESQVSFYNVRLRDILLYGEVKNMLKIAFRENGFSEMNDTDYRQYVAEKSTAILSIARDSISASHSLYPYLDRGESRFSRDEAFDFTKTLFDKARLIKLEKTQAENQIFAETSLLPTSIVSFWNRITNKDQK